MISGRYINVDVLDVERVSMSQSDYLNIWVLGEPIVSIKMDSEKQKSMLGRIHTGAVSGDVFIAVQNCPQFPVKRIEV